MQFRAGNWKIILTGPRGSINLLIVIDKDKVLEEIQGKFLGIAPPQEPHRVSFLYKLMDGSRIHFVRQDGTLYVSPPCQQFQKP